MVMRLGLKPLRAPIRELLPFIVYFALLMSFRDKASPFRSVPLLIREYQPAF